MEIGGGGGSLKSDINVTPLVDVMLVMLIIFMLVTPLLQEGVSVSLPEARNVAAVPEDEDLVVVVALKETGALFLGDDPTDWSRLVPALHRRLVTNPVVQLQIKADRNVRYSQIKKLIQAGREAGFDGASLIAEEIKPEITAVGGG